MSRVAKVSRRSLLRGMGGVAVGLPPLEIMLRTRMGRAAGAAVAGAPPPRYTASWAGVALSPDGGGGSEGVTPKSQGLNWAAPRSLKALADFGILSDITVVSGLLIPWNAANPPFPAGKGNLVHFNTMGPQLSGTRGGGGALGSSSPTDTTHDMHVADAISAGAPKPFLAHRMQAYGYVGGSGVQSYRKDKGSLIKVDPISSPRVAYESLFTGFTPPSGAPTDPAKKAFFLRQGKSVLDLVAEDLGTMKNNLGAADKRRLEQHADQVRQLEKNLDQIQPVGAQCKVPKAVTADPAREGGYAYAGEDIRGDVYTDLIAMALACDMSRVASYMLTYDKCWMGLPPGMPRSRPDIHQMSHEGPALEFIDAVGYLVKQWGKLVKKLKDIPENDGSTVLDHTLSTMIFEAGHGKDSETGGNDGAHSTENMVILFGGGAKGKIKKGIHYVAKGKHPASVLLTGMKMMGVQQNNLGEVTEIIPGIMT